MNEDFKDFMLPIVYVLMGVIAFVCLIGGLVAIPVYYGSCREASVYNKQNKTSFTCSDFFWASDQINQQTQTIKLSK